MQSVRLFLLNVIMLSVVMLSIVMLSVIMLSVVAPLRQLYLKTDRNKLLSFHPKFLNIPLDLIDFIKARSDAAIS
jgi:hypothetical protein